MGMRIKTDFPYGNLLVKEMHDRDAVIAVEQRDSPNPWFYWCFRAVFDEKGEYRFVPGIKEAALPRGFVLVLG